MEGPGYHEILEQTGSVLKAMISSAGKVRGLLKKNRVFAVDLAHVDWYALY